MDCRSRICATASACPRICTRPPSTASGWFGPRCCFGTGWRRGAMRPIWRVTSAEGKLMHNQLPRNRIDELARLNSTRPVKVLAVTGGKGGVGKTTVSTNLAVSIAARGRDVMLVDADLGMANVDVLLGLPTRFHMGHVINGDCALEDAIVTGPHGLQIVPAASGIKRMANLSVAEHAGLIRAFSDLYP